MSLIEPSHISAASATSVDTQAKALAINMDPKVYGTFAEIGAGQEIAAWFFKVGGAAGTIAKTMSAYDMKVSDDIYGKTSQYVSESRLRSMLNHEYSLLSQRLSENFGQERTFFVLADTVSARNFKGTNECHGWVGLRHQETTLSEPSDILLHINLLDDTNFAQQEALGILGVNLIYAAYYLKKDISVFLKSLLDDLGHARIEIDCAYFEGGYFSDLSGKDIALELLYNKLSPAVMISRDGVLEQPSAILRKKKILVERGGYRLLRGISESAIDKAQEIISHDETSSSATLYINELSIKSVGQTEECNRKEIVELTDSVLNNCQDYLLLTSYTWYYDISQYIRRYSKESIGFIMGLSTVLKLFNQTLYDETSGNLLEALGKLFAIGAKVYVYAMPKESIEQSIRESNGLWELEHKEEAISLFDVHPTGPNQFLFKYLISSQYFVSI